jgi:hypothetical protein
MKREILTFCNKLSKPLGRVNAKFLADMLYGMTASGSVLLSNIADVLKEPVKKKNTIGRLSQRLSRGVIPKVHGAYFKAIEPMIPDEPVVLVDDTDIIKPYGKKFDALGIVRDGSASGNSGNSYGKGYYCTEMVMLSNADSQPVSLFSHIHSSHEKDYKSANTITYHGLAVCVKGLRKKATFIFDRGYDSNAMFLKLNELRQDFIIRLTAKRKLFVKGKWISATALCASRKGKFKTTVLFRGEEKECYISHINAQITASKKPMRLVLVYGLGETPMMLATNRQIKGKDDVVSILRMYMSRWRIEEYFRFKKQHFGFENYRVRRLKSMNALNQILSYAITFLAVVQSKNPSHRVKCMALENAGALREKTLFYYYRIAKGTAAILARAKAGIRDWFKPLRENPRQLSMRLDC